MIRQPRKVVGRPQGPVGVVNVQAELILIGETWHGTELSTVAERVNEIEQGFFTLAADYEIDIPGVKRGVGVERREVPAPDDGNSRIFFAKIAAQRNSRLHLRTWHD